mgnify:CR=1 FL=1
MFFFFTLILKVQTLTEAVEDSLTGQLAKIFALDPGTIAALLIGSTIGALVIGGLEVNRALVGWAFPDSREKVRAPRPLPM